MIHIGISGPIGSGKSTLAISLKQLAQESGYACAIIPFAYGVREVAAMEKTSNRRAELVNLFYSYGYDYSISISAAMATDEYMTRYPSTEGIKNRKLLQCIGTEVGRVLIDEDIWIKRTQQEYFRLYHDVMLDFLISDDVRFDNEVMAVDVHVHINTQSDDHDPHISEHSVTLPALYTIQAGFKEFDVLSLFEQLNKIRMLRL